MVNFIKKLRIKNALKQTKTKAEKLVSSREQSNEAKTLLYTHKKRKPKHHAKVAIKKD